MHCSLTELEDAAFTFPVLFEDVTYKVILSTQLLSTIFISVGEILQGSQERHCREYISQRTSQILQGSQEKQEINLSHMKVGYQYRVCNYVYDESIDKHLCNTKYEESFFKFLFVLTMIKAQASQSEILYLIKEKVIILLIL